MNYNKLRSRPKEFRLVCGLNIDEFDSLLTTFEQAWDNYFQHYKLNGEPRSNAPYVHRNNKVKGVDEKLFFILFYIRQNPTQSVMAAIFEMEKYQANQWIHLLLKILKTALMKRNVLPEREPEKIKVLLEHLDKADVIIDGTERPVPRSTDHDTQMEYYSGKKKRHMIKNNLITDKNNKVLYLSSTYEGSVHDKKICDEEDLCFPKEINLWQDTGFQGYHPKGVHTIQPIKKKKGKILDSEAKKYNQSVSRFRVYVEHVIGRIKIFRIVKDTLRNVLVGFDDLIMEICCGLHNFIIDFRPVKNKKPFCYSEKD